MVGLVLPMNSELSLPLILSSPHPGHQANLHHEHYASHALKETGLALNETLNCPQLGH